MMEILSKEKTVDTNFQSQYKKTNQFNKIR